MTSNSVAHDLGPEKERVMALSAMDASSETVVRQVNPFSSLMIICVASNLIILIGHPRRMDLLQVSAYFLSGAESI